MKFAKILKFLTFVFTCIFSLFCIAYLIDNIGGWIMYYAQQKGFEEIPAENIGLMATAALAFFFTSDAMYLRIRKLINGILHRSKGLCYAILLGLKAAVEILVALPKRTILFSTYLIFVLLELMGIIEKAKEYGVVSIFIMAVDRVTKIWPEEKERLFAFAQKLRKRIGQSQKDEEL